MHRWLGAGCFAGFRRRSFGCQLETQRNQGNVLSPGSPRPHSPSSTPANAAMRPLISAEPMFVREVCGVAEAEAEVGSPGTELEFAL